MTETTEVKMTPKARWKAKVEEEGLKVPKPVRLKDGKYRHYCPAHHGFFQSSRKKRGSLLCMVCLCKSGKSKEKQQARRIKRYEAEERRKAEAKAKKNAA